MSERDFEEETGLSKDAPLMLVLREDLESHSVEVLHKRKILLQDEILRTENAISLKGEAQVAAERFFK